jgi:putative PIG3 family NAD(P)H quinone oxidoreductase
MSVMRAIRITQPGGPEVLQLADVPIPEPGPSRLRVRVAATAINRADLSQIAGRYPAPPGYPQDIPGLEYAGTVDAVGAGATRWREGDRVMGITGGGGWAEFVVVHEDEAIPVPSSLPLELAAAIPEVFMTAHDALLEQAHLSEGETLLVHGAGSGVGTAATQIARSIGAIVLGTARSQWKLDRARELGLAVGIDSTTQSFEEIVERETDGRGVNVILDLVGGDNLGPNVRAIAKLGRIIIVGVVAGSTAELNMRVLMGKRAFIRGTVLRARSLEEKIAVARAFSAFAEGRFESGQLQPVIDRTLSIEEIGAGLEAVRSNETFGKVVLTF